MHKPNIYNGNKKDKIFRNKPHKKCSESIWRKLKHFFKAKKYTWKKWKDISYSLLTHINIINMSVFPNLIYKYDPNKNSNGLFYRAR